jgi:hypothetical protein
MWTTRVCFRASRVSSRWCRHGCDRRMCRSCGGAAMQKVALHTSKPDATRSVARRRLRCRDRATACLRRRDAPLRFIQVGFTSIDAASVRAIFDVGLSGVRGHAGPPCPLAVTVPYYEFREVLTVRASDRDRYRRLRICAAIVSQRLEPPSPTTCSSCGSSRRHHPCLPTKTSCIRIVDLLLGRGGRCPYLMRFSRSVACDETVVLINQPGSPRRGPLRWHSVESSRRITRSDEQHPARCNAGRTSRTHFQALGGLERDQPRLYARVLADSSPIRFPHRPSSVRRRQVPRPGKLRVGTSRHC